MPERNEPTPRIEQLQRRKLKFKYHRHGFQRYEASGLRNFYDIFKKRQEEVYCLMINGHPNEPYYVSMEKAIKAAEAHEDKAWADYANGN